MYLNSRSKLKSIAYICIFVYAVCTSAKLTTYLTTTRREKQKNQCPVHSRNKPNHVFSTGILPGVGCKRRSENNTFYRKRCQKVVKQITRVQGRWTNAESVSRRCDSMSLIKCYFRFKTARNTRVCRRVFGRLFKPYRYDFRFQPNPPRLGINQSRGRSCTR